MPETQLSSFRKVLVGSWDAIKPEGQGKKLLQWYDKLRFPKHTKEEQKVADKVHTFLKKHPALVGWGAITTEAIVVVGIAKGYSMFRKRKFTSEQGRLGGITPSAQVFPDVEHTPAMSVIAPIVPEIPVIPMGPYHPGILVPATVDIQQLIKEHPDVHTKFQKISPFAYRSESLIAALHQYAPKTLEYPNEYLYGRIAVISAAYDQWLLDYPLHTILANELTKLPLADADYTHFKAILLLIQQSFALSAKQSRLPTEPIEAWSLFTLMHLPLINRAFGWSGTESETYVLMSKLFETNAHIGWKLPRSSAYGGSG